MKNDQLIWCAGSAAAVVVLALALSGCNDAPTRVEPPPPKVSVQHPEMRKLVDYDQYNGWLKAVDTLDIRARVRGHLDKVDFIDGDFVKADQILFELDPRPFEAEVGRAGDQVKIYEAQLVAAAKEEARFKELVQKGGASQSQVDTAEAQRKALEAEIEAGKQEVTRRQLDLDYAKVRTKIAGRIGQAKLSVGSLVNAGGGEDVLATVVSVDPIYVVFTIDERSLQRYMATRRAGNSSATQSSLREAKVPFKFKLETDNDYVREGVLDFADNRVNPTTGTIEIQGTVKNDKGQFISGTRVSLRIPVSDEHEVMLVPDTAILTDQSKKYLLVLDDKKVVQRRDVEPGKLLDDGTRVVRTQQVKPDDWIITQGLQTARINYPVDPVMPAGAAPPTSQPAAASAAQ